MCDNIQFNQIGILKFFMVRYSFKFKGVYYYIKNLFALKKKEECPFAIVVSHVFDINLKKKLHKRTNRWSVKIKFTKLIPAAQLKMQLCTQIFTIPFFPYIGGKKRLFSNYTIFCRETITTSKNVYLE